MDLETTAGLINRLEDQISGLKEAIADTYRKKGQKIIDMNHKAVDSAMQALMEVKYPASWADSPDEMPDTSSGKPEFIKASWIRDGAVVVEAEDRREALHAHGPTGETRHWRLPA